MDPNSQQMDLSLLNYFFHISLTGETEHVVLEMPATDLLKKERMDEVIQVSGDLMKAIGTELPASFVGMGFFGVSASVQLVLATYNRLLDLSLSNLTFQVQPHDDHVHSCFRINELKYKEAPTDPEERQAWLVEELTAFYRDTVRPVIEMAAVSAGVKPDLVWSQYGARMAYAVDYMEGVEKRPEVLVRFRADYETLARVLPPELFGRRRNPFDHKPRYIDSPYDAGKKLMMRSACCMYDRRENGEKCYNCPMMLPEEREERRRRIEATREKPGEQPA
ncbi:(2Fe-2S)-binding protein [Paenibacillus koleovorans]|uniref:(2Fe-2S)-binding protein n=1 Tax=Paenibacillus koleovorans TaxID=121608 RepID=UPI000FD8BAAE|nr:(2Fe-2S)-binding protein [Paenibacillus koleovorans]